MWGEITNLLNQPPGYSQGIIKIRSTRSMILGVIKHLAVRRNIRIAVPLTIINLRAQFLTA